MFFCVLHMYRPNRPFGLDFLGIGAYARVTSLGGTVIRCGFRARGRGGTRPSQGGVLSVDVVRNSHLWAALVCDDARYQQSWCLPRTKGKKKWGGCVHD